MTSVIALSLILLMGLLLGGFFFGGLWWTVQKGLASNHPAIWFFGSTLARTAIALAGFYLVARDDWRKFLVCLLGFVLARVLLTRLIRSRPEEMRAPQQ